MFVGWRQTVKDGERRVSVGSERHEREKEEDYEHDDDAPSADANSLD